MINDSDSIKGRVACDIDMPNETEKKARLVRKKGELGMMLLM